MPQKYLKHPYTVRDLPVSYRMYKNKELHYPKYAFTSSW